MRPAIKAFAERMELALAEHDEGRGARGWLQEDIGWLCTRLLEEVYELEAAITMSRSHEGYDVVKEAVDVANFAMMIADVTLCKLALAEDL